MAALLGGLFYCPAIFSKGLTIGNEQAAWVEPKLVCTVQYMMKTEGGGMRQSVFKGLRTDKGPKDCVEKSRESTEA